MDEIYRGWVDQKITLTDEYGNKYPATRRRHTKPYSRKNIAAGQTTVLFKNTRDAVAKGLERVVQWEPA